MIVVLQRQLSRRHSSAQMRAQRPILPGAIRPGSIVVLHKGTDDPRGVEEKADPGLGELARAGLRAVTVSELVTLRRHGDHGYSPSAPPVVNPHPDPPPRT